MLRTLRYIMFFLPLMLSTSLNITVTGQENCPGAPRSIMSVGIRGRVTFIMAYIFARRRKTLKGITPYEFISAMARTTEKFTTDPYHLTLGLYI